MAQPQVCRLLHGLSFLAILALPIVPIGYLVVRHWQGAEALFSPGSLASAHEGLECTQCHVEPWRGWHKAVGEAPQTGAIMDRACAQCHGGLSDERPPNLPIDLHRELVVRPQVVASHHPRQVPNEVGSCSDCHHDHQGEKQLLHVTEDQCTRCHSDLRTVDGRHTFYPKITAFDTDHPPFGSWREGGLRDPGALHFNHQIHLCLDSNVLRGIGETLDRLKRQECDFCHQPDSRGAHMAPVRYDKHCAECHPLAVQIVTETKQFRLPQAAAKAFGQEPAPHLAPDLVLAILRERLRLVAQREPTICADPWTPEPIQRMPGWQPAQHVALEISGWVDDQASKVQRLLFDAPGGCRYCHIDKSEGGHHARLPEYQPTNIPAAWFPHAKFSHGKHGLMPCSACHEKARISTRTADVLLPSQSKCLECHSNQQGARSHARADCLECHPYHGRTGEPAGWLTISR